MRSRSIVCIATLLLFTSAAAARAQGTEQDTIVVNSGRAGGQSRARVDMQASGVKVLGDHLMTSDGKAGTKIVETPFRLVMPRQLGTVSLTSAGKADTLMIILGTAVGATEWRTSFTGDIVFHTNPDAKPTMTTHYASMTTRRVVKP